MWAIGRGMGLLWAVFTVACDWSTFSDLEENAPVVVLPPGEDARGGFGQNIAAGFLGKQQSVLLIGGTPGRSPSSVYSLGLKQSPSLDPSYSGFCSPGDNKVDPCVTANMTAFLPSRDDLCFGYAWGGTVTPRRDPGIAVRCLGGLIEIFPVAESIRLARDRAFGNTHEAPLMMASSKGSEPVLLAALPQQNALWYYDPSDARNAPTTLALPPGAPASSSRGSSLAVLELTSDTYLLAAGDAKTGEVWLYRRDPDGDSGLVGCLGGRKAFGRTLAAGDVDADGVDDLVVADERLVTAFSGAALAELPRAADPECTLVSLPAGGILASFTCGSRGALAGCAASEFGAALAVGDLDGDDDGEILVGAPGMRVYGSANAGAVLVYDAEEDAPPELSDVLYISSAEGSDRLGTAVVAANQGDHDVVVAGAPGGSKVAIFYCSALLPDRLRTGRCER